MKVIIVGAGPSGLFLAHRLLAHNSSYTVQLYECKSNLSTEDYFDGKGFGLGLGARAQQWLKSIDGLWEELVQQGIELTPSGVILIPQRQLCALLLQLLLARYGNQTCGERARLAVDFKTLVVGVDLSRCQVLIEKESGLEKVAYDLLVGADGIHSKVRSAMMVAQPEENDFIEQKRPQVWKVLQLPVQPEVQQPPRLIPLRKRSSQYGLIFGGCLPQKDGRLIVLIFWQPKGKGDAVNPQGVATVEELQQLLQEMMPKGVPALKLDQDGTLAFLAAQPMHEYWSKCRSYHDLEGRAVLIGDAAHGMFSMLAQGCTAAIADAVALDLLLQQYDKQLSMVLPEFSQQQVKEGHAASDVNLIALVFYHQWWGLFYKAITLLWVVVLKQPNVFAQTNQVGATYVKVLHQNRLWVWIAQKLFQASPKN